MSISLPSLERELDLLQKEKKQKRVKELKDESAKNLIRSSFRAWNKELLQLQTGSKVFYKVKPWVWTVKTIQEVVVDSKDGIEINGLVHFKDTPIEETIQKCYIHTCLGQFN